CGDFAMDLFFGFRRQALVLAALMLAAVPAYGAADEPMTGRWFSEGFEHGEHLQVIFDLQAGGTYGKDIRVIDDNCGVAVQAKETGKWERQRANLATVTETIDGKPVTASPADTHNLFRVERVDDEHINLFDTDTRLTWGLMLVTPDYMFPVARGCGL